MNGCNLVLINEVLMVFPHLYLMYLKSNQRSRLKRPSALAWLIQ
ncbi:hypothetical protein P20429_1137 [Pseudoalteromonas sp. BSi20429]|nr:hypothetical protein P20429_1137 [Pseudoalteromonas sp. BSi20429]